MTDPDKTEPDDTPEPSRDEDLVGPGADHDGEVADTQSSRSPGSGPPGEPAPSRRLGDYELFEELGRGGMGVVYRARQVSLKRWVALKLAGHEAPPAEQEVLRFRREAESVAALDHPGIVPIYEVGEASGRPYFSMKLLPGGSLGRRLREFVGDPRAAALLVARIAEGVHHAHQRGILHRDLKPSNVLLDADGSPLVADFGLAKRFDANQGASLSGEVVGTPVYMAPEQAWPGPGGLTTATDVYGLGAILYALLTGSAPHRGSSLPEVLADIRDRPVTPPSKADPKTPKALEVICLKCLENDPGRRYGSAQAVADDLRAWIDGRPIAARPVSPAARAWMWCRRKPAVAGLTVALTLALIGGAAGIVWNWLEVRRQRDFLVDANKRVVRAWETTKRQWEATRRLNDVVVDGLIMQASPLATLGRPVLVVKLLDGISASVGRAYAGQPKLEASLRQVLGDLYRALGKLEEAEMHLIRAMDLRAALPPEDELDRLSSCHGLGALRFDQGRFEEAGRLAERALSGRRRMLGPEDEATIASSNLRAIALQESGHPDEAERMLSETLHVAERKLGPDARETCRTKANLAAAVSKAGRFDEAEALSQSLLAALRRTLPADHPEILMAGDTLGCTLLSNNKAEAAVEILEPTYEAVLKVMGPDNLITQRVGNNLGAAYRKLGRDGEARVLMEDRPPIGLRPDSPLQLRELESNRAADLMKRREYGQAEPILRTVLDWDREHRDRQADLATTLFRLAVALAAQGKTPEAEPLAAESLGLLEKIAPASEQETDCCALLGRVLLVNGKVAEAERPIHLAFERRSADPLVVPWKLAASRGLRGAFLAAKGEREEAEPLLLGAYAVLKDAKGAPPARVEEARTRLIRLYENWPGREHEAARWLGDPTP